MKLCYIRENQIERSKSADFIYRNKNKPQLSFRYPCPFVVSVSAVLIIYEWYNGQKPETTTETIKSSIKWWSWFWYPQTQTLSVVCNDIETCNILFFH